MADAHWHVLGAGAIGGLFAHSLARAGNAVTLVLRAPAVASPLIIEGMGQRAELALPCVDAQSCGPVSHLLVTTKAYDARAAVASIAHRLGRDTVLLLMVNGMGIAEQLQKEYPKLSIYCGTTTEGAYRVAPLRIHHAGRGATRIGRQGQWRPPQWFDTWSLGLDNCHWDPQIDAALWEKLAINCVINPLTAVYRCRNGALRERAELRQRVFELCREIRQVSYAAGYTDTAQTLHKRVTEVIAATRDNRSSMLQDVEAGRPTEIGHITGYLLRVARAHGIPASHNAALLDEVLQHGR
ncbi:MAG: 2-dehydropantoate 2-reductase [Halioglobus sp.]|nr:2-dehydropantoate 2-reductase [Halioglobus sp.]